MRFDDVDDVLKVSGTAPGITKALFNFFRCVVNDTIIGNVYVHSPVARPSSVVIPFTYLHIRINRGQRLLDCPLRSAVPTDFQRSFDDPALCFNRIAGVVPVNAELNRKNIQNRLICTVNIRVDFQAFGSFQFLLAPLPENCIKDLYPWLFGNIRR